ncbi:CvpA family protein [Dysosmobacter sp.]|uniref:CvpA family protein n=1 Tax=Dysosmobacter sp. TaxID=2591382 RepID=UPI002A8D0CF0|nr:CvpA family protein [Dysosmobacter sp.]MDY3281707.1 CvpA family protein [Dysosmobacter sp.]
MPFSFHFGPGFGGFQQSGAGPDFSQFQQERPRKARKARKPIGNAFTRTLLNIGVTLVFALVYFYLELPALNFHDEDFYLFVFLCCAVYCICAVITSGFQGEGVKGYLSFVRKQCTVPFAAVVVLFAVILVGTAASWVVLRANSYSKLLTVEPGDFAAEVEEISFHQIPMLDRSSAARLGARKLGELADMVSQFEVMDNYTQINYQGRPVRVTSLGYADIIKWFTNRSNGLPAYLIVDMVTQDVEVVRLEEGMKYTTAEHFNRNLYRHIRFRYPTYMFANPVFEIDEEGTPYWICPRVVRTIGLFGGTDIRGAVLVNAVTGESEYYEEVPAWVDQVYVADLIMQQYDYYGLYKNGFFNSILGQRDVTQTTDGYNYIAIGDDVYMYTGVTSVTSDQSNIGFLLSNQRTKETKFYSVAGATEESAQRSAEGQVQQMRYEATFPLLLNIADQPTYFMALKDAAGLVKMYAMVNVEQYQIVSTGTTVAACETNYRQALAENGLIEEEQAEIIEPSRDTVSGTIEEIRTAVMNGDSHYFLRLKGDQHYYVISAADAADAVILNVGDRVEIGYDTETSGTLITAYSVEIIRATVAAAEAPAAPEAATPEAESAA